MSYFGGMVKDAQGFVTAGCWLARRPQQLKASTTMDLGISIFLIFVPENAGKRQQSESIEAALDMEQRKFDEPFCYWSVPSL